MLQCLRMARASYQPAGLIVVALGLLSCAETQQPLTWEEAARGGLGETPVTLAADTLLVANATYHKPVGTGHSAYFTVGQLTESGSAAGEITAVAYLKWDLSELPDDGEVTSAALELILRGYERTPEIPEPFVIEVYAADEAWEEDSLGIVNPAYGDLLGASGEIDVNNMPGFPHFPDSTDAALTANDFDLPDLIDLVAEWRADEQSNHGLVIRPSVSDPPGEGFLRFISREGTPRDVETDIFTPGLVVGMHLTETGSDTLITLKAAADGFGVVATESFPGASGTLSLGSGYVERVLLGFDISDQTLIAPGAAVHRAVLHLNVMPGADWAGDAEKMLSVYAYTTTAEWTEEAMIPAASIGLSASPLDYSIVAGDETTIDLDIHGPVQEMIEGAAISLVLRCGSEADLFRSLTLAGRTADEDQRPTLTIVFSEPATGRLGPWPQTGGPSNAR